MEALFCLAYSMRRIAQLKPMQRLEPEERYARFRYSDFQEWTGVHRATQCRILPRLIERGFLGTAAVHKQNENVYGQLFVDGPLISLVRTRATHRHATFPRRREARPIEPQKKSTPTARIINAPLPKRSTLRNINLKREIEEQERFVLRLKNGYFGRHGDSDLRRIVARAAQMVDQTVSQPA